MTGSSEPRAASALPGELTRRFEAIVCDGDPSAADRVSDVSGLRRLIEDSCAVGIELVIVSDAKLADLDGWLGARPAGPGRLLLAVDGGSEVFRVDRDGPQRVQRRGASDADAPLSLELGRAK
jgi:hypothetical protein